MKNLPDNNPMNPRLSGDREAILQEIRECVDRRILEAGKSKNLPLRREDLNQELNLYTSGILDSFDLFQFLLNLEQDLQVELDISELDPEEFTNYNRLIEILLHSRIGSGSPPEEL